MRLLYDGRCTICKTLAFKIHFLTDGRVDILSLHTAEARHLLDGFYPRGWAWDFYVVTGDRCRKGLRALRALLPALGASPALAVLAEYGRLKLAARSCAEDRVPSASRRAAIKTAAMAPLLFGASSLSVAALPTVGADATVAPQATGPLVHVAEVGPQGATAYACPECVRSTVPPIRSQPGTERTFELLEDAVLADYALPAVFEDTPRIIVGRRRFNLLRDGGVEASVALTTGSVVHGRYDVSVTIAHDGGTTMGGMCRHDLPLAIIDYVVVTDRDRRAPDCVLDYAQGVVALSQLHAAAGRAGLAALYTEMASALSAIGGELKSAIAEDLWPRRNKLVITSIAELLGLTALPADLAQRLTTVTPTAGSPVAARALAATGLVDGRADAAAAVDIMPAVAEAPEPVRQECGWGCCCGCGACLSCGCSIGLCWPPCVCCCAGCEAGCGCGCGYCCGVDLCS